MGEYATHDGQQIKIGTCESMYYLRADQARDVTPLAGSVDPLRDAEAIRFRFPFPDEDAIEPGQFEDYNRRIRLDGMKPPAELVDEHYSVQFKHEHGYLCSLPCPEAFPDGDGYGMRVTLPSGVVVHRNGFKGAVFLSQQVLHNGALVPVLECACGVAWRLRTFEDAADLLDSLDYMHKRLCDSLHPSDGNGGWTEATQSYDVPTTYSTIADRVRQGYDREHVAALGFGVTV